MNMSSDDDDDTFYYEVEKILDMQAQGNTNWFFIKWKNYDETCHNTWEPEHNLNCPEILEEFLLNRKRRKKPLTSKRVKKKRAVIDKDDDGDELLEDESNTSTSSTMLESSKSAENRTEKQTENPSTPTTTTGESSAKDKDKKKGKKKMNGNSKEGTKESTQKMLNRLIREKMKENAKEKTEKDKTKQNLESNGSSGAGASKKVDKVKKGERTSTIPKITLPLVKTNNTSGDIKGSDKSNNKNKDKAKESSINTSDINGSSQSSSALELLRNASSNGSSSYAKKPPTMETSTGGGEKKVKTLVLNRTPWENNTTKLVKKVPKPSVASVDIFDLVDQIKTGNILPSTSKRFPQKSQSQAQAQAQLLAKELTSAQKPPQQQTPPQVSSAALTLSSDRDSASPSPKTKVIGSNSSRPKQPLITSSPQHISTPPTLPTTQQQLQSPKITLPQQQLPSQAISTMPSQHQLQQSQFPMQVPPPPPRDPTQFKLHPPVRVKNPGLTFHSPEGTMKKNVRSDSYSGVSSYASNQNRGSNSPTVPSPVLHNTPESSRQAQEGGVKRLAQSKRDPRLEKRLRLEQPTFSWTGTLFNGDQSVCQIKVQTLPNRFQNTSQLNGFLDKIKQTYRKNELRIESFLPLKRIEEVLKSRSVNLMDINETNEVINMSRLVGFLRANDCGAVVHHPDMEHEALVLIQADSKTRKILGIFDHSITKLFGIYITNLPGNPKIRNIQYIDEPEITNPCFYLTWDRAVQFFKIPLELKRMMDQNSKFMIYGSSELTGLLTLATKTANKNIGPIVTSHVMMFDRYNDTIFTRSLFKHKKEMATKIWEFGTNDLADREMIPAAEAFPKLSAGLIITDTRNIISNPSIIKTIVKDVNKLNNSSTLQRKWRFILPSNFIRDLKDSVRDAEEAKKAQDAMVMISMAMSNGDIQILQMWTDDAQKNDKIPTYQYIDKVARYYYKQRQFFVYVDDIGHVNRSVKEHQFSTDFVESSDLCNMFSQN